MRLDRADDSHGLLLADGKIDGVPSTGPPPTADARFGS
jgi:hypothetical protein